MIVTPEVAVGIAALIIGVVGGWYTAKSVFLKTGTKIRGNYGLMSSVTCEDKYVSHVTLYNLKDRATAVFNIFLQLGYGYYVEIENFETAPLILKPFETWHREYDPIEMYTANLNRIDLEQLLDSRPVRRRLVLSTAEGKYVVKEWIKRWNPVSLFFRNYKTEIIHPRRSTFEGKSYGSNALYVVELTQADGKREMVPIYRGDDRIRKFKKFRLTEESLASARDLEEYLLHKAVAGVIACRDLKVHDLQTWRAEAYEEPKRPTIVAERDTWFEYYVMGFIATKLENRRLRRQNQEHHRNALARIQAEKQVDEVGH